MMPELTIDDRAVHGGSPKSVRQYHYESTWEHLLEHLEWEWETFGHAPILYCRGTLVVSHRIEGGVIIMAGGDGYTYRVKPTETVYVDYNIEALDKRIADLQSHSEHLKYLAAGGLIAHAS